MKKTVYVHLNFDDFHPEYSARGDFGGDPDSGVFKMLSDLTVEFPGLCITLFTTPNWVDAPYTHHRYYYYLRELMGLRPVVVPLQNEPFRLSKHPVWCDSLLQKINEGKFEVAVHGLHHYNPNSRIHGQELCNLSEKETEEKIKQAEYLFQEAGIPFLKVFRPPGWGENQFLSNILSRLDYKIYANKSSRSKSYEFEVKDGLTILPQNWSIRESKEEAIKVAEKYGMVFMKGHLVYRYGREVIENGITKEYWENLRGVLRELQEKFDVKFISLSQYLRHQK